MREKTLRYILQAGIALAFITPLIVGLHSYIFPFVVPKVLYLRLLMSLLAVVLALAIAQNGWRSVLYATPVLWAVGLFFVSSVFSTVFSVDVSRSFWDNHERMLGLYTLLHYGILYLIARSSLRTWNEWQRVFIWILVAAIPMVVIAWYQLHDPNYLYNQGSDRVRSTLGNTIYLSDYCLYIGGIAGLLAVWARSRGASLVWIAVTGVSLLTMVITMTRGTMLGMVVGLLYASVMLAFSAKDQTSDRVRLALRWSIALGIAALMVLFAIRNADFVRSNAYLSRLTDISLTSGTGATRLMAWKVAITSWKEHPLFGWGLNNFFYAFNAHYNPAFLHYGITETWFDNAHSMIFNTLATAGVLGLIAYLALYVAAFWMARRIAHREPRVQWWRVSIVVQALLIAQFIHNLFVFENVTSLLLFFLVLAFIDRMSTEEQPILRAPKNVAMLALATSVVIALFGVWSYSTIRGANVAVHTALGILNAGSFAQAMQTYESAKSYQSPHQDDIVREFATSATNLLNHNNPEVVKAGAPIVYPTVKKDLEDQIAKRSYELRLLLVLGGIHFEEGLAAQNPQALLAAKNAYERALALSPHRQQIIYQIAQVDMLLGQRGDGEAIMKTVIRDDPDFPEPYWRLAMFYAGIEDASSSARYFREALDHGLTGGGLGTLGPQVVGIARDVFTRVGQPAYIKHYEDLLK